jgi:ubiquinone/menaquinone biosynthesis C-methylase UbiE
MALYLATRTKESRIYSDEVVSALPRMPAGHPLHGEWRIRDSSSRRLLDYLAGMPGPLALLDVGCGNGWMAARLARLPGCEVCALDLNRPELEQGARVWGDLPGLTFVYGNLLEEILPEKRFDIVTLAGSIQYFPDVHLLMDRLFTLLKASGEVHIIDSPFYNEKSAEAARERTRRHYRNLGHPEMAAHYHHHLFSSLNRYGPVLLYDPRKMIQRIKRKLFDRSLSPFPWVTLKSGS